MLNILTDRRFTDEAPEVLRGAVFHINMGLWGSQGQAVPMLKCTPGTALLSFLAVLDNGHIFVTYEVLLSIQRLIQKSGSELPEHTWDVVCEILLAASNNIDRYIKGGMTKFHSVFKLFHETLDIIEVMLQKREISVESHMVYDIVEKVAEDRSEVSVLKLIEFRATRLTATTPNWLQSLKEFIERFYNMTRSQIRVKAVHSLMQIMESNRAIYEDEILDRVVLVIFANVAADQDILVRGAVARMLIEFTLHCETKRCVELFDIIAKLLNRPFDLQATTHPRICFENESDVQDIVILVDGLVKIFLKKLYRLPATYSVRVYHLLIAHLDMHYKKPGVILAATTIKYKIFSWMLFARANGTFRIGYPDPATNNKTVKFSHYLGVEGPHQQAFMAAVQEKPPTSPSDSTSFLTNLTTINIQRGCQIIVKCLETDSDWTVIQLILEQLPNIMQNRALIQGNNVEILAKTLHAMYFNDSFLEKYITMASVKLTISDVKMLITSAIASLATYHQYIETATQKKIVEVLQKGLFSRIPKLCVQALTVMILEMQDTLARLLPTLLWDMSRMSNTVQVAIPVLEFLSTLSRLPNHRFSDFTTTQYMYVFAISIPYTNPDRYDHYIVSLAHHVIAGWFLKCRLSMRRNLVTYIIASLDSNLNRQLQDLKGSKIDFGVQTPTPVVNEDSSNRKRSSSLTEQGSRRRERPSAVNPALAQRNKIHGFHVELVETCYDFMARHTYSPCSAVPKRLPTADYLLKNGQSMTWLVGHSLITITTSGCARTPTKSGYCDHCSVLCKATNVPQTPAATQAKSDTNTTVTPLSPESSSMSSSKGTTTDTDNKRYTKASLQHSSANDSESTDLTSSTSSSAAVLQQHQRFARQSSTDGRFSSNSSSLEALSRRDSNPDTPPVTGETENSFKISTFGNTLNLPQMTAPQQSSTERTPEYCICLCAGWAEICIRRPTGTTSWVMRIQNQLCSDSYGTDVPLQDITSLFSPSLGGETTGSTLLDKFYRLYGGGGEIPTTSGGSNLEKPEKTVSISKLDEIHNYEREEYEDEPTEPETEVDQKRLTEIMENLDADVTLNLKKSTHKVATSGPIDIPSSKNDGKYGDYDSSNSGGEGEEGDENIEYDDNDPTKGRNPVRRVNSSPEMSANWRTTYTKDLNSSVLAILQQKSGKDENHEYTMGAMEMQQQQGLPQPKSKKTNFAKDPRVSCEAIPEEIAGSTPPSLTNSLTKDSTIPLVSATTSVLISSASLPEEVDGSGSSSQQPVIVPKKQLSADDAINQQESTPKIDSAAPPSLNLKIPIEMPKVTSKPPQSPAPLSPRLLAKNAANKISVHSGPQFPTSSTGSVNISHSGNENSSEAPRGRSKTISVVREHYGPDNVKWALKNSSNSRYRQEQQQQQSQPPTTSRSGISPSYVFLQLYHSGQLAVNQRPLLVDPKYASTINIFDYIPPFEMHTIAVLYVGPGQCNNETEILKNRFGSVRYTEFLRNLGTLVAIKDAKEHNLFINIEEGKDGNFTYIWRDEIVQVIFHVATIMPNKQKDPNCKEKNKYIGNNYVKIVYNESGEEFNLNTIRGQFNYACIIVQPLELNTNKVFVIAKEDIASTVSQLHPKIVSDSSAPLLARQMALHANFASKVFKSLDVKNQTPYASNWLERLRKIKGLRAKIYEDAKAKQAESNSGAGGGESSSSSSQKYDFTSYT